MKFSAQEEYGLRCLIAIASQESGSMTIPEISEREGISQPHAAKILSLLKEKKFITAIRGQRGGYSLSTQPTNLLVADVLVALGGKLFDDEFCDRFNGENETCVHYGNCNLAPLYGRIQGAVESALKGVTLADLLPKSLVTLSELSDREALRS
jgi:Rrf2 family protein